ncbi:MAG: DNA recombination protein RmuC [Clostridia bacterium]|nr:DNA recombination protein RmuC [Clostridia bacterium]
MNEIMIALLVLANILLIVILVTSNKNNSIESLEKQIKNTTESLLDQIRDMRTGLEGMLNISSQANTDKLNSLMISQNQSLQQFSNQISQLTQSTNERLERIVITISNELDRLVKNNEQKLNEMRQTVDEKLNSTLEKRLNASFNLISNRLEAVYTGLGEMKNLASGVGELKNVLTNVKNRGVMGEISLNNILRELMTENQYKENYQVKPTSQQRVDFAIFIPDKKGGKDLILPIYAKFPIESYFRLCDAYDTLDQEKIQQSAKELENAVKKSAKSIAEKYINVPITTDFAIMYLPIEGLYSEVVRRTGLIEEIQRNYKIMVTGPNTLSAFINSLQLGFKTLTIEKRSNEIWNILVGFKKEFSNFVDLLGRSQKQINTVSTTLENATKRTQMIEKQLQKVDEIEVPISQDEIEFELKETE